MTMKLSPYKNSKAFTLIELSFVILIIGILVAAIILGKNLISRSRITSAQTLTQSSPIISITDLRMWLETSLDRSFKPNEMNDNNSLTLWNDINSAYNKVLVINVGTGPVYSNTINGVHAVKFDSNSATNHLSITNASFLNNTDYTIFVLEKRESNQANNYFLGDISATTSNQNLVLGYSANGAIIHSQAGSTAAANTNSYQSSVSNYTSSENPRVFSFIQDSTAGKKTYINGMLAAQSTNTNQLSNLTSLKIGNGYQGQIGELVIFTKALTDSERRDVEAYMGKKWNINNVAANISASQAGITCTNGTVTVSGCQINPCNVPNNTTGIVNGTTVNQGTTSFACNQVGASGSINYTCVGGIFNLTSNGCGCTSGYSMVSGVCQSQCTFSGVTGVNNGTIVNYASSSTSFSCNASGYSGSVNYTCVGGVLNATGPCTAGCPNNQLSVSGGSYTGSTTNVGVQAQQNTTFTCSTNYGSPTSVPTCQSGGVWSFTNITCLAPCFNNLMTVTNGSNTDLGGTTARGQYFLAFSCSGTALYTPIGPGIDPRAAYTCQSNGTWTSTNVQCNYVCNLSLVTYNNAYYNTPQAYLCYLSGNSPIFCTPAGNTAPYNCWSGSVQSPIPQCVYNAGWSTNSLTCS